MHSAPFRLVVTGGGTGGHTYPALTAVRWDLAKVGTSAAELLLARMNSAVSARDSQRVTIPTELVLRDSCAQP